MTENGFNVEEFRKSIAGVNKMLEDFGPDAIEQDTTAAGFNPIGYKWQYIADAVNEIFDGWRYDLISLEVKERGKAYYGEARLQLDLNFNGTLVTRGPTIGGSTNPNEGDAQKGAITDALKKAFSLFSIGNQAMRGKLEKAAKSNPRPQEKKAVPKNPAEPEGPPSDMYVHLLTLIEEATCAADLKAIPSTISKAAGLSEEDKKALQNRYNDKQADFKKIAR